MNDVRLVGGGERVEEGHKDADCLLRCEDAVPLEDGLQRRTLEVLHDDEGLAVFRLTHVEDVDDARVVDDGRGARLEREALLDVVAIGQVRDEHLDGDAPADGLVGRRIHRAHAAFAEHSVDQVLAGKRGAGLENSHRPPVYPKVGSRLLRCSRAHDLATDHQRSGLETSRACH